MFLWSASALPLGVCACVCVLACVCVFVSLSPALTTVCVYRQLLIQMQVSVGCTLRPHISRGLLWKKVRLKRKLSRAAALLAMTSRDDVTRRLISFSRRRIPSLHRRRRQFKARRRSSTFPHEAGAPGEPWMPGRMRVEDAESDTSN